MLDLGWSNLLHASFENLRFPPLKQFKIDLFKTTQVHDLTQFVTNLWQNFSGIQARAHLENFKLFSKRSEIPQKHF